MAFSIVILTYNEQVNLARCLRALNWCDDIVVLDSYSTDATVALARSAGVRVVQNRFENFGQQRSFAMEHVEYRHEWVFQLDADEVFTDELKTEIEDRIGDSRFDAYWIPSKLIYMGRWLKHAGTYPYYQVRLGRKSLLRYAADGHTQRCLIDSGRIGRMDNAYLHHNFSKGLSEWFDKHNRYSTAEADKQTAQDQPPLRLSELFSANDAVKRRQALKRLSRRLPCRPLLRFLYLYLIRLGFLDGQAGWNYSRMIAMYELMIDLKVEEIRQRKSGADAEQPNPSASRDGAT